MIQLEDQQEKLNELMSDQSSMVEPLKKIEINDKKFEDFKEKYDQATITTTQETKRLAEAVLELEGKLEKANNTLKGMREKFR